MLVLRTIRNNFSAPAHEDPAETRPILDVSIDHERDDRILRNISQALEHRRPGFGLFVDSDVERYAFDGETDRHDMRLSAGIRRGKTGDTLLRHEFALGIGQHVQFKSPEALSGGAPRRRARRAARDRPDTWRQRSASRPAVRRT